MSRLIVMDRFNRDHDLPVRTGSNWIRNRVGSEYNFKGLVWTYGEMATVEKINPGVLRINAPNVGQ